MQEFKDILTKSFGVIISTLVGTAIVATCCALAGALVWSVDTLLYGIVHKTDPVECFFVGLYVGAAVGLITGIPTGLVLSIASRAVVLVGSLASTVYRDDPALSVSIWIIAGVVVGGIVGAIMMVYEVVVINETSFSEWAMAQTLNLVLGAIHTALGGGAGGMLLAWFVRWQRPVRKQSLPTAVNHS